MRTLSDDMKSKNNEAETYYDVNSLLREGKKIVTFMGGSKSGSSFILNNVAQFLSTKGINVAILDATRNKNSYYIYTRNEEGLRRVAFSCIEQLANGEANGIKVNNNLTVYTTVPGEDKYIQAVDPILETLLKNHALILIDCDFNTPIDYFKYAAEIYLIQTMEVLTIQPLTEVLSKLKSKGMLIASKLRIIINKYVEVNGITEKEIIGGMSFYNDPTMAYMKELFDRNSVRYMIIPFEKEIYEKYLSDVANCNITTDGYPYGFVQKLNELANEIIPRS